MGSFADRAETKLNRNLNQRGRYQPGARGYESDRFLCYSRPRRSTKHYAWRCLADCYRGLDGCYRI